MATEQQVIAYTGLSRWELEIEDSGHRAQVIIPSIGMNRLDRKGCVSVVKLQSLFSEARIFAYLKLDDRRGTTFLEYDKLIEAHYNFIASGSTWFSREFLLMHFPLPLSLAVRLDLGFVGTSSLNSRAQLVDRGSGVVYAENINQVVSVGKDTRRPTPLPQWWVDKYGTRTAGLGKLVIPEVHRPPHTYQYPLRVVWSDTDMYGHCNYMAYVRFCYDAAMEAIKAEFLANFKDDICCYITKDITMLYRKECQAGSELVVHVWQDENADTLRFQIDMAEATLFQCKISFHEGRIP